jgi:hypothetical protein
MRTDITLTVAFSNFENARNNNYIIICFTYGVEQKVEISYGGDNEYSASPSVS